MYILDAAQLQARSMGLQRCASMAHSLWRGYIMGQGRGWWIGHARCSAAGVIWGLSKHGCFLFYHAWPCLLRWMEPVPYRLYGHNTYGARYIHGKVGSKSSLSATCVVNANTQGDTLRCLSGGRSTCVKNSTRTDQKSILQHQSLALDSQHSSRSCPVPTRSVPFTHASSMSSATWRITRSSQAVSHRHGGRSRCLNTEQHQSSEEFRS